jgi:site-specific recombinase XerD
MVVRLLPALGNRPRGWDARLIRKVICGDEAGLTRSRKVDGHGAQGISPVPRRAWLLQGRTRARRADHPAVAAVDATTHISAAQVERLIATCDVTTPTGLRDRAILLLLARLGLRGGDVVSLRLSDFDWQQATLSVRGKGRRETRLPLPQDAGDAVLAYLERARPRVGGDRVFFLLNAPIRPLSLAVVTSIVRSAIRKAGIDAPTKGARLLRHSAATDMLCGGATLDMVGAVLRHRSPDMTAHYAKVDIAMLQQVTQPWPGDVRC